VIIFAGTPYAHLHICGSPLDGNEYQTSTLRVPATKEVGMAVRPVLTVVFWRLLGADPQGCIRKAKPLDTALSMKANFLRGFFRRFH
jgi:hypothetical protein